MCGKMIFPGARADLVRIKSMSPDEILSLAGSNGLIYFISRTRYPMNGIPNLMAAYWQQK